ncbi:MAG: hypothetical protein AVDCRST_MAG66-658 [uncultured Pseudonocardia sp.]|uniref:Uncharacterized protein n=1 Tax=uncultured Pseudonocardia sp. TaxID=211455 RepID=A0A6J4NFJ2_9PSEU|nr:MAG: hypothetical protein AVDCRST_MAG66-658 [uncultured Pseudonocardia sp.]
MRARSARVTRSVTTTRRHGRTRGGTGETPGRQSVRSAGRRLHR